MNQMMLVLLLLLHTVIIPLVMPTDAPTKIPTAVPTKIPTAAPTTIPTAAPSTATPSTRKPTATPTMYPTTLPTLSPIAGIYTEYTLRTFVFIHNTTIDDINATDSRNTLTRTMKNLLDSYEAGKIPAMSISLDLEDAAAGSRRNLFIDRSLTATGTNAYYSLHYTLENTNCTDVEDLVYTVNYVLTLSGSSDYCSIYKCFIDVLHTYDEVTRAMKFRYVNYVNVSDTYVELQSIVISQLQSDSLSFVDSHKEVLLMFVVALAYIFVFIASGVRIALHKKSKLSIKSNEGMLTAIENPVGKTLVGLMKGKGGNKVAAPLFVSRKEIEKPQINDDGNATDSGIQMQKGNLLVAPRAIADATPLATQMPKTVTLDRTGPIGRAAPLATQMPKTVTLPRSGINTPPRPPLSTNASPRGFPPPPPPPSAMQNARPPPPRPPATANIPPSPSGEGSGGSEKFGSFKKLLNMNVPQMAVRNKMLMQGISQSEIDNFFNTL